MTIMNKRSLQDAAKQTLDYVDVDYVGAGLASTIEESNRLNQNRRTGMELAAEIREHYPDSDFAVLPAQFQPIVASLFNVGANPGNLVLNISSDSSIHLFGTVFSTDRNGWRIFHASSHAGDASDTEVRIGNIGTSALHEEGLPFDTMEDAIEVLQQIQELCIQDPDAIDRMATGTRWQH